VNEYIFVRSSLFPTKCLFQTQACKFQMFAQLQRFCAFRKPITQQNTLTQAKQKQWTQFRKLHLHEYQSQALMKPYGINIPAGSVALTADEAERIAEALHSPDLIVKAQVLAGGRGLGVFDNGFKSGVHPCHNAQQVREIADKMLGHRLFTKQTGPQGKPVNKVLVAKRYFLRRETYLAILLDRVACGPVLVGSAQGGVDIEKIAAESPDAIIKEPFDLTIGPKPEQTARMARSLGFPDILVPQVQKQISALHKFFVDKDATLVEINPFAETSAGEIVSVDCKINFDDNAAFRQKDAFSLEDLSQKDPREVQAAKFDLNYIGLDGNIGCLVNGAGLAMSTLDLIKFHGGSPANFLDIGGGASKQQVTEAIKILSQDPRVKVILINIFGGIMRCDIIALGLIAAVKELSLKIPLIVRLQGTSVIEAKQLMADSGLRIISVDDLDEAAQKACNATKILQIAEDAHLSISFELPL